MSSGPLITADDHVTVSAYQMLTNLPCHIYIYILTLTTTLFCHFHAFCFAPVMWYESLQVFHKHW